MDPTRRDAINACMVAVQLHSSISTAALSLAVSDEAWDLALDALEAVIVLRGGNFSPGEHPIAEAAKLLATGWCKAKGAA